MILFIPISRNSYYNYIFLFLTLQLKEIQAPQGSNCSALAAAVASTAAADQTTSQNAAASAKDVAQGTPKATVQLKEDLSESNEQNQTKKAENILVSGDIKPQSAATVSAQNNNNSATALPDKSVNSVTEDGKVHHDRLELGCPFDRFPSMNHLETVPHTFCGS